MIKSNWGKIKEWFNKFFTNEELSKEKEFIKEATAFNELYLLKNGKKKVRVMMEDFSKKKTLIAEYENFETDICKYLENIDIPPEAGVILLEAASGTQKINCIKEDRVQKFAAIAGLDFWWPQLTGMLRVSR